MPSHSVLVPVEEYLHTVYEPDVDYIDGVLEDRNVGEKNHGHAQGEAYYQLRQKSDAWNIYPISEARLQVSATRFRVPEISVFLRPEPDEQIFTRPPFLCIEILSCEDRMSRMQEKIADYLGFGVAYVWVVDPETRRAWVHRREGSFEARDGVLRTAEPNIEIRIADLFR